jgi:hypothetical protein
MIGWRGIGAGGRHGAIYSGTPASDAQDCKEFQSQQRTEEESLEANKRYGCRVLDILRNSANRWDRSYRIVLCVNIAMTTEKAVFVPRYKVSNGLVIGKGAREAFDLNNLYVVLAADYDVLATALRDIRRFAEDSWLLDEDEVGRRLREMVDKVLGSEPSDK